MLTTAQARKLRAQYGPNEIILQNKKSIILHFLKKLFNPLIITLIFVAGLSFFLGENVNSVIIIAMAILSVILSFVQEYHASRTAEKLRAMIKIDAVVLRDGQKIGFSKAYIAQYSPRPGTVAAKLKDDVPQKEKRRRWELLDRLINKKTTACPVNDALR